MDQQKAKRLRARAVEWMEEQSVAWRSDNLRVHGADGAVASIRDPQSYLTTYGDSITLIAYACVLAIDIALIDERDLGSGSFVVFSSNGERIESADAICERIETPRETPLVVIMQTTVSEQYAAGVYRCELKWPQQPEWLLCNDGNFDDKLVRREYEPHHRRYRFIDFLDENGELVRREFAAGHELHGHIHIFDKNSKLPHREFAAGHELHGHIHFFDEDGKLVRREYAADHERHGTHDLFDENGELVRGDDPMEVCVLNRSLTPPAVGPHEHYLRPPLTHSIPPFLLTG